VSATNIGLWLIGVGSIFVIAGALISPPEAGAGVRFPNRQAKSKERLVFAVEATGLTFIAGGSVDVALSQSPTWWLIGTTLLAIILLCDVFLAWPLRRAWVEKSKVATAVASTGGDIGNTQAAQRQAAIARRCATWRWCLLHPLNDQAWPGDGIATTTGRPSAD
jgi:hypothetical protein